jgi:hypothetical protein
MTSLSDDAFVNATMMNTSGVLPTWGASLFCYGTADPAECASTERGMNRSFTLSGEAEDHVRKRRTTDLRVKELHGA